ncbi:hypothetical protein SAMN02800692_2994 [Luteibacter sp. UNC138MFCol5.1]|uniref:hypothetical protein n=1 Tax=Luteibacter sp. UNC138MFCol5.1 TaxID=1502774 RepID=UPI0008BA6E55|nr:hypothetical protein [Luteibacter sp. UNC138MFCol5.1]SEO95459.1 hypothetical protein SAMN02800692_2994 [Luteibacter sp. UNC138MFCol5.1]
MNKARTIYAPGFTPTRAPRRVRGTGVLADQNLTDPLTFAAADLGRPKPDGTVDNMLHKDAAGKELTVTVPIPDQVKVRDTVWIAIDGVQAGAKHIVTLADKTAKSVGLPITADQHAVEGAHSISYTFEFTSGAGGFAYGPRQGFIVDTTKPGEPTLADMTFPDAADGYVTIDSIIDNGTDEPYVVALVDGYSGYAPENGDEIIGYIDGQEDTVHLTNNGTSLEFHFGADFIIAQHDGERVFQYKVIDRAWNESALSQPTTLTVLIENALTDLKPPSVPSYDNDADPKVIDEQDAREAGGLKVVVPQDDQIEVGDDIWVTWASAAIGPVRVTDPSQATTVGVLYPSISAAYASGGGTDAPVDVAVSYEVWRGGGIVGRPDAGVTVKVNLFQAGGVDPTPETPENENLLPASLQSGESTDAPNTISLKGFELDAKVTIPWKTKDDVGSLILGDVIGVKYGKAGTIADYTVTAADVLAAEDLELTLPKETLQPEGSGDVALTYTVARSLAENGPNLSSPPAQIVKVTGKDGLPGGGTLAPIRIPAAEGHDTIDPLRLLLGPDQTPNKDTMIDFVIPEYANQKAGDTIVINIKAYDLFGYEVADHTHPADDPSAITDRDILGETVEVAADTGETRKPINGYRLMGFNAAQPDPADWIAIHAHVVYTVTNSVGTSTSPGPVLDLDGRGGPNK